MSVKSFSNINFPKLVFSSTKEKYIDSPKYLYQSLANIFYSASKYIDSPQLELFLEFCQVSEPNYQLIFYLYMRQFYKIITYTNFQSMMKTQKDPSNIHTNYQTCLEIIEVALGHDEISKKRILQNFQSSFNQGQRISFYQFLISSTKTKILHKDIPMLERILSLYNISTYDNLKQSLSQKQKGITYNQIKKQVIQQNEKELQKENQQDQLDEEGQKEAKEQQESQIRPVSKLHDQIQKYISQFFIQYTKDYQQINKLKTDLQESQKQIISKLITDKINLIVFSLFTGNRQLFFGLMRSKLGEDEDTYNLWVELNQMIDQIKEQKNITQQNLKEFLLSIISKEKISQKIDTFYKFKFQSELEIFD